MDKVLSQEEINALFSAMSADDLNLRPQTEKSVPVRKVVNYDFHRADRISQDQMRSIHLLHEHFGRNFASSLSAYLRAFVDVSLASLEQLSYSSFIKSLSDPTLFASIGMRPLDANIALELNPSMAFPMIDMILGGAGCALPENRNLTEIEMNIIEGVIKLAMRDLRDAWHSIMDLEFFLDGKGTKAQMFQIVSPAETVIAVHLELKIGDYSGMLNLCIPSRVLKMLRNKFDQQWNVRRPKATGGETERILELMKPVFVSLTSEIQNSTLTVDDLLKVSVGDVIELTNRVGDPALLCVGGNAKFMGRIVQKRGKRAFEISERFVT
jgi:flagellar motor switch protein FliM